MIDIKERIDRFNTLGMGLFVHYGAYSFLNRGEWALNLRNLDLETYKKEALSRDYSLVNLDTLIDAAKSCGAKYITLTTRHHDGFSLYDTKGLSTYDIMHTPNGRDLIKDFVEKCRDNDITPFLYHTTLDWQHRDFDNDFEAYLEYLKASVKLLCTNYGEIGGFWFDGNWSKPDADWKDTELYSMIRELQPNCVIINNTGLEAQGVLANKEIDVVTFEQGKPFELTKEVYGREVGGEMCLPINEHWGIADDINYKSVKTLLESAVASRRYKANFLLGVSPMANLEFPTIQQGLMQELGKWIHSHSNVFYYGKQTKIVGNDDNFVLQVENKLYAFIHNVKTWGDENVIRKSNIEYAIFENFDFKIKSVRYLEDDEDVDYLFDSKKKRLIVKPSSFRYGTAKIIRVLEITTN